MLFRKVALAILLFSLCAALARADGRQTESYSDALADFNQAWARAKRLRANGSSYADVFYFGQNLDDPDNPDLDVMVRENAWVIFRPGRQPGAGSWWIAVRVKEPLGSASGQQAEGGK